MLDAAYTTDIAMSYEDKNARQCLTFPNIINRDSESTLKDNTAASETPNYSRHSPHYSVLGSFFSLFGILHRPKYAHNPP